MAAIGSVTCDFVKGEAPGPTTRTKVWAREGINGIGMIDLGKGADAVPYLAILRDTLQNVLAWVASIESLAGTVVSITNDAGTTYTNVAIERIWPPSITPYMDSATATIKYRAEIQVGGMRRS